MSVSKQRLYDLLPAYIRFRDQQLRDPELGIAPLEALINALELPLHALEENIDALSRSWFIETCDEWKVPYIADLLGIRGLDAEGAMLPSQRSRVANTIAYRRRKGTPAALAWAAQDVTGWPCHVTELGRLTATTQALGAPMSEVGGILDLRDQQALDRAGTPFGSQAHTADLRRGRPGKPAVEAGFQPQALGLAFWRLQSYPVRGAIARPSSQNPEQVYRFHPSGVDAPLFNPPLTPDDTLYESEPRHLPMPLVRRDLADEIAALRKDGGQPPENGYFGHFPAFRVATQVAAIPPRKLEICDLSDLDNPRPAPDWGKVEAAVDPQTGRILFPERDSQRQVRVDYSYGACGDIGGGPYPRGEHLTIAGEPLFQAIIDRDSDPELRGGVLVYNSLAEALEAWRNADTNDTPDDGELREAVIRIADTGRHDIGDFVVELPLDRRLRIEASERCWPHLVGEITVNGDFGSRLKLEGLGIEGGITLRGSASLTLSHCTVQPRDPGGRAIDYPPSAAGPFTVTVDHSILTGSVRLPTPMLSLEIADSIVGTEGGKAIEGTPETGGNGGGDEALGPPARIARSTLFGEVSLHRLLAAANTLFTGHVQVARPREGSAHHCYFPSESTTPPRHRCLAGPRTEDGGWLRPAFTSTTYGHPGYAQLSHCSGAIRTGGENRNEIGVYHQLRQSDRWANLEAILDEYLPAGFSPRISLET